MSHSDNLSAVLDAGREHLPEGDYIKLADFLSKLHKKKEENDAVIIKTIRNDNIGIEISFETLKGKKIIMKIETGRYEIYSGPVPNRTFLSGHCNDVPFVDWSPLRIINRLEGLFQLYGMKNIKRKFAEFDDEFASYAEFAKFCSEKSHVEGHDDDDEDDEPTHWRDLCNRFVMSELFGLPCNDRGWIFSD
jgi:hypothetical protein